MAISIRDQQILNRFADTQPGLRRIGELPSSVNMRLGDIVVPMSAKYLIIGKWSFANNGGFSLSSGFQLSKAISAGILITSVVMEVITPVTVSSAADLLLGISSPGLGGFGNIVQAVAADYNAAQIKSYFNLPFPQKSDNQFSTFYLYTSTPGASTTGGSLNFYITCIDTRQAIK